MNIFENKIFFNTISFKNISFIFYYFKKKNMFRNLQVKRLIYFFNINFNLNTLTINNVYEIFKITVWYKSDIKLYQIAESVYKIIPKIYKISYKQHKYRPQI